MTMYYQRYNQDEMFDVMEKEFDLQGLEELFNDNTTRFLNDWAGDQEDAADAAVFNAVMY